YSLSAFARDGGLLSYGTDPVDLFRRAASYADRILRGILKIDHKPRAKLDHPIRRPRRRRRAACAATTTPAPLQGALCADHCEVLSPIVRPARRASERDRCR